MSVDKTAETQVIFRLRRIIISDIIYYAICLDNAGKRRPQNNREHRKEKEKTVL